MRERRDDPFEKLAQKGKAVRINLRFGFMSLLNETVKQLIV